MTRLNLLPRPVTIQYRRLPNRLGHFHGVLRQESKRRLVIEQRLPVRTPRYADGNEVVTNGYVAIWFIFKRKWFDVGKFYDRNGIFTGYYCDIIRPVARLLSSPSKTSIITDLFLDLWINRDGACTVLDEDQLKHAIARRFISRSLAARARNQISVLVRATNAGHFPPKAVKAFQLTTNNSWPMLSTFTDL